MSLDSEFREALVEVFFTNPDALGLGSSPQIEFFHLIGEELQIGYHIPRGYEREKYFYELDNFDELGRTLIHQLREIIRSGNDIKIDLTKPNYDRSTAHTKFELHRMARKYMEDRSLDEKICTFWKHIDSSLEHMHDVKRKTKNLF